MAAGSLGPWAPYVALIPPVLAAGAGLCLWGRLGIRREGDTFRGGVCAWLAYLGGPLAALVAVVLIAKAALGALL